MGWFSSIGKIAKSAISHGEVLGAIGSILGDALGVGLSYEQQSALMDKQYNLSMQGTKENLLKNPGYYRQGLEAAGYNPLLALGGLSGSNAWSASSAPGASSSSLGSSAVNAYQARTARRIGEAQIDNFSAQTDNQNADAALKREQAITEQQRRLNMEMDRLLVESQVKLNDKSLSQADRRFYTEMYEMAERAKSYSGAVAAQQMTALAAMQNAQTNAHWTPAKIGAGLVTGLGIGALGPGKFFKAGQFAKHSLTNSKIIRSLHTFGKTRVH